MIGVNLPAYMQGWQLRSGIVCHVWSYMDSAASQVVEPQHSYTFAIPGETLELNGTCMHSNKLQCGTPSETAGEVTFVGIT